MGLAVPQPRGSPGLYPREPPGPSWALSLSLWDAGLGDLKVFPNPVIPWFHCPSTSTSQPSLMENQSQCMEMVCRECVLSGVPSDFRDVGASPSPG